MFKLFIVDDEPTIRKGLTQFVPWNTLDAELIGDACDGRDALARIREMRPDIVITDIKMPIMDGLELARALCEEIPEIKVIILTGYADFAYAQTAIRYGVTDFVLKPTSKDKIIAALKRAQEQILSERKTKRDLSGEISVLREQILEQLTRGLAEESDLSSRLETYQISLEGYCLAAFQLSEYQKEKKHRNILSLKNMVSALNKDGYTYFYDSHIVLSIFKTWESVPQPPPEVLKDCREIAETVNNFSDTRVRTGLSLPHRGLCELPEAAEEVIRALSEQFFIEQEFSVYSPKDGTPVQMTVGQNLFLCTIESFLESYDFDAISASLREFFLQQRATVANSRDTINVCVQIHLICARVLARNNRPCLDPKWHDRIGNSLGVTQLEGIVADMLRQTEESLRRGSKKDSPLVAGALAYIDENYGGSLQLGKIAEYVHVNPQHLCRVFKKERGETINEYITRVRIEAAKALLEKGDILAYEVAQRVGFKDAAYFSMIFKKYTGVSPKSYLK